MRPQVIAQEISLIPVGAIGGTRLTALHQGSFFSICERTIRHREKTTPKLSI
jgi:hypothetical protein